MGKPSLCRAKAYLLIPWREDSGETPLTTVFAVTQKTLLDTHPLSLLLYHPLALPQPLEALLVLLELVVQLTTVAQQELLLGLALTFPRL